jgi:hypothetical protein
MGSSFRDASTDDAIAESADHAERRSVAANELERGFS